MKLSRVDFHLHQLGFELGIELGQRRVAGLAPQVVGREPLRDDPILRSRRVRRAELGDPRGPLLAVVSENRKTGQRSFRDSIRIVTPRRRRLTSLRVRNSPEQRHALPFRRHARSRL
jgi:hypothetical protein